MPEINIDKMIDLNIPQVNTALVKDIALTQPMDATQLQALIKARAEEGLQSCQK